MLGKRDGWGFVLGFSCHWGKQGNTEVISEKGMNHKETQKLKTKEWRVAEGGLRDFQKQYHRNRSSHFSFF